MNFTERREETSEEEERSGASALTNSLVWLSAYDMSISYDADTGGDMSINDAKPRGSSVGNSNGGVLELLVRLLLLLSGGRRDARVCRNTISTRHRKTRAYL
jgi:hypothetical protein